MKIDELISILLIKKKDIFKFIFIFLLINTLALFFLEKKFISKATILPHKTSIGGLPSSLSSLSGLMDLDMSSSESTFSPDIYPSIIQSEDLAEIILNKKYVFENEELTLFEILSKKKIFKNEKKRKKAFNKISKSLREDYLNVSYSNFTDLIKVSFSSKDPHLSNDVLKDIVYQTEIINNNIFNRKQIEKVSFLKNRIDEVKLELVINENLMIDFMDNNSVKNQSLSPTLELELKRLQREVNLKSQVLLSLNQQYEIAKIDLEDSSSVLHIIDSPSVPVKPSFPQPIVFTIFSIFLGIVSGIYYRGISEYLKKFY